MVRASSSSRRAASPRRWRCAVGPVSGVVRGLGGGRKRPRAWVAQGWTRAGVERVDASLLGEGECAYCFRDTPRCGQRLARWLPLGVSRLAEVGQKLVLIRVVGDSRVAPQSREGADPGVGPDTAAGTPRRRRGPCISQGDTTTPPCPRGRVLQAAAPGPPGAEVRLSQYLGIASEVFKRSGARL